MFKGKLQLLLIAFLTALIPIPFQVKDASGQQCTAVTSCASDADCVLCGTCWTCNVGTAFCEPDPAFCDDFSGGLEENLCRSAQCIQGSPSNPTGCDYSIDPAATELQCILCEEPRPTDFPACGNGSCEFGLGENCENCAVDCLIPGFDEACPRGGPIPPEQLCLGPDLGLAGTFAILADTYSNTTAGTVINGDVGYTTPPVVVPTINGTTHVADATYAQAGLDQAVALAALNGQACTFTFAPGAVDLASDTTHGPIGVYTPGVYCMDGAASVGTAGITLNGSGTYIFRMDGALTSATGSSVALSGGAAACNVWWTPTGATTLAANSSFIGTLIDVAGSTIGGSDTWLGRVLAFGGTISTDNDIISVPIPTDTPTPVLCDIAPQIVFPGPPFTGSGDAVCEDGDLCTQSECNVQTDLCEAQTAITACSGSVSDLCCPAFCEPFDANVAACNTSPITICDIDCLPEVYCPFCGNDIIDPGEECDGTAANTCGPEGCNLATCQCNSSTPPPFGGLCLQGSGFGNNSGKAPGDCSGWTGCSLGKGTSAKGFILPLSVGLLGILLFQRRSKRN